MREKSEERQAHRYQEAHGHDPIDADLEWIGSVVAGRYALVVQYLARPTPRDADDAIEGAWLAGRGQPHFVRTMTVTHGVEIGEVSYRERISSRIETRKVADYRGDARADGLSVRKCHLKGVALMQARGLP